jgi:hypothetical protein
MLEYKWKLLHSLQILHVEKLVRLSQSESLVHQRNVERVFKGGVIGASTVAHEKWKFASET